MAEFNPSEHFDPDLLQKRERLREEGISPYPHEFDPSISLPTYNQRYEDVTDPGVIEEKQHKVAGRVVGIRDLGNLKFVDIADISIPDEDGQLQLIMESDEDGGSSYEVLDGTDEYEPLAAVIGRGDHIGAIGYPVVTETGELSLYAARVEMLSKALNQRPAEGLSDRERVRNRALAISADDELHQNLRTRFELEQKIREYLWGEGFLETPTQILENVYGGAAATPFTTYAEAKDQEMYLRIALELPLKSLTVGGFGGPYPDGADEPYRQRRGVFEIGKVFRNEDIDRTHNPEFTMLELYEPYADYEDMMDLTENLITSLVEEIYGEYKVPYGDEMIDFSPGWDRIPMDVAVENHLDISLDDLSDEELRDLAESHGGEFPGGFTRGLAEAELFEEAVEEELWDPVFIIDHPEETTPLCKHHRAKDGRIERFELFVGQAELANSYTELNDPVQQGKHFAEQVKRREQGDAEAHQMDEAFLRDQAYGMPLQAGLGIGIDRLAMLLTNTHSIREVIPFPMVGRED